MDRYNSVMVYIDLYTYIFSYLSTTIDCSNLSTLSPIRLLLPPHIHSSTYTNVYLENKDFTVPYLSDCLLFTSSICCTAMYRWNDRLFEIHAHVYYATPYYTILYCAVLYYIILCNMIPYIAYLLFSNLLICALISVNDILYHSHSKTVLVSFFVAHNKNLTTQNLTEEFCTSIRQPYFK